MNLSNEWPYSVKTYTPDGEVEKITLCGEKDRWFSEDTTASERWFVYQIAISSRKMIRKKKAVKIFFWDFDLTAHKALVRHLGKLPRRKIALPYDLIDGSGSQPKIKTITADGHIEYREATEVT